VKVVCRVRQTREAAAAADAAASAVTMRFKPSSSV